LLARLSLLWRVRFGLAAFLIPLGIRGAPEIIAGPYSIGWDTIASYVPTTLDLVTGKIGWQQMLGIAPLLYMISGSIYILTRANPILIFKVMGPVLYGGLMLALFRFLKIGLVWDERRALGGVLLASLYFITLRLSWDLYRNMLGLTFILLSLPLLQNWKTLKRQTTLAAFLVLAIASDQLTGVIVLFLVGARALEELSNRGKRELLELSRIAIPGVVLFLSIVYAFAATSGQGIVREQSPIPDLARLGSSLGFLGYAYLPIAPLIIVGMRSVHNLELRNWCVVCTGGVLTGLFPFFGLIAQSPEWTILLCLPLCVYATWGLVTLAPSFHSPLSWVRQIQGKILPVFATLLVLSATLYIMLPAQRALPYYAVFPEFVPTTMGQDTVPLSDMGNLRNVLSWVAPNMGPGTVLITHEAIYGWARAYLPSSTLIMNYGFSSPLSGAKMARLAGYSSILMIWWVNGSGWYGQPNVPTGFVPLSESGNMAVYAYY
jgi:hypothetical protein